MLNCSIFTRVSRAKLQYWLHSPLLHWQQTHQMSCRIDQSKKNLIFCLSFLHPDDNSNQSSIADSSPVKQENSCSTSPTPEPTTVTHRDNSEAKTDQSPDSKRGETLHLLTACKDGRSHCGVTLRFANAHTEALRSLTSICPFHS